MKQFRLYLVLLLFTFFKLNAQTTDVIAGLSSPIDMFLNGNDLYFTEFSANKISKIDLTDSSPAAMDVITGLNGPYGLLLNGNDLYISEYIGNKISKIDITDASPVASDVITGLNSPHGLAMNGNELYISEFNGNKISKIDITDASPVASDVITGLNGPSEIILSGNELYIAEIINDRVSKFDITNPISSFTTVINVTNPYALFLFGNNLYIARFNNDIVSNLDVTDVPPVASNEILGLDGPSGMVEYNNSLYIIATNDGKIVKYALPTLSTNTNEINDNLSLYPNPSNDYINILGLTDSKQYQIFDSLGKNIIKGIISNDEVITIKKLVNGIYFLKIENNKPLKFIKN